jgi:hypothetical protein
MSARLNALLAGVFYPIGGLAAGIVASLATVSNIITHGPSGVLFAAMQAGNHLLILASDLHSLLLP